MKQNKKQANQYDKIFKENIEAVIPSLMQNVLGITAVFMEELPDDVQHTKERKPDLLKKVTDNQGNTFVLQIEFQVADEPEMVYRMAEYYIMLERKYKMPVQQFVIFLGSSVPKMPTQIERERFKFSYLLFSLSEMDYLIFVHSDKPEEVVLGILADFKEEDPENALKQILQRIEETTDTDFSLQRYFNQLRILAQLRNLDLKLKNAMDSIAKHIKEERDVLYLRGREKEKEILIINLLKQTDFSFEKIANLANATVDFVKSVKQKISADK
jgi:hypothetical protein